MRALVLILPTILFTGCVSSNLSVQRISIVGQVPPAPALVARSTYKAPQLEEKVVTSSFSDFDLKILAAVREEEAAATQVSSWWYIDGDTLKYVTTFLIKAPVECSMVLMVNWRLRTIEISEQTSTKKKEKSEVAEALAAAFEARLRNKFPSLDFVRTEFSDHSVVSIFQT